MLCPGEPVETAPAEPPPEGLPPTELAADEAAAAELPVSEALPPAADCPAADCRAPDCPAPDCPVPDCLAPDCPEPDCPAPDCLAPDCLAADCPAESTVVLAGVAAELPDPPAELATPPLGEVPKFAPDPAAFDEAAELTDEAVGFAGIAAEDGAVEPVVCACAVPPPEAGPGAPAPRVSRIAQKSRNCLNAG